MNYLGRRIQINPQPALAQSVMLEVAMMGHCPGTVDFAEFLALRKTLSDIRDAGFAERLEALIAAQENLDHLPIPLRSATEFDAIFPEARSKATHYKSKLAGAYAWLAQCVDDFFANGGLKLWIIPVDESEGFRGFLPHWDTPLYDTVNLRGIATALSLPQVGIIVLPDLERIQIAADLADIPRLRLVNPKPRFLPCSSSLDDGPSRTPAGFRNA